MGWRRICINVASCLSNALPVNFAPTHWNKQTDLLIGSLHQPKSHGERDSVVPGPSAFHACWNCRLLVEECASTNPNHCQPSVQLLSQLLVQQGAVSRRQGLVRSQSRMEESSDIS